VRHEFRHPLVISRPKFHHLTRPESQTISNPSPLSLTFGQVAKITTLIFRVLVASNFRRLPTTRFLCANQRFRDETASDPFITGARHVFLPAQDALDALKSHKHLMINMVLVHKRVSLGLGGAEKYLSLYYSHTFFELDSVYESDEFLVSFLVYFCSGLRAYCCPRFCLRCLLGVVLIRRNKSREPLPFHKRTLSAKPNANTVATRQELRNI
jgi:hypothetical protein